MAHVATVKTAPDNPEILYLCTAPDMAPIMGGFGPARYVGNSPPVKDASYTITLDDLPRFRVYCANRSVHLVDSRDDARRPSDRPAWAERPLPECSHCGQPASRKANRIQHCPNCGNPWDPIEVGPAGMGRHGPAPLTQCASCDATTLAGFDRCMTCGGKLDREAPPV